MQTRIARHTRAIVKGARVRRNVRCESVDNLDVGIVTRVLAKSVQVRWLESGSARHDAIELTLATLS